MCGRYAAMEKCEKDKDKDDWVWNEDFESSELSICFLSPKLRS